MPISYQAYINPELQKKEEERNFWRSALLPLGAAAVGASFGGLLVNPIGRWRHSGLMQRAKKQIESTNAGREVLDELYAYHRGTKPLQEFGTPEQQEAVLQQYEKFKPMFEADELIKDRIANSATRADRRHFQYLDQLSRGQTTFEEIPQVYHHFLENLYQKNKQLFDNRAELSKLMDVPIRDPDSVPGYQRVPLRQVYGNPVAAFQYPAVSGGALLGYGAGQMGAQYIHHLKNNELVERAKQEREVDLNKVSAAQRNNLAKQASLRSVKKNRDYLFIYTRSMIQ